VCGFSTAWAAPEPIWKKIGEMFPALAFELEAISGENGDAFKGSIRNGRLETDLDNGRSKDRKDHIRHPRRNLQQSWFWCCQLRHRRKRRNSLLTVVIKEEATRCKRAAWRQTGVNAMDKFSDCREACENDGRTVFFHLFSIDASAANGIETISMSNYRTATQFGITRHSMARHYRN
jgi:hypothetical protein